MDQKNLIGRTKSNMTNTIIQLFWAFIFGINGKFLVDGYGAAKYLGYVNWVLCGIHGLFMLAYLLLVIAETFLAPKGGATVHIKEDKQDECDKVDKAKE